MGLGHSTTGTPEDEGQLSDPGPAPVPWKWNLTGRLHNEIETHREVPYITALCVPVPFCYSPMENGTVRSIFITTGKSEEKMEL